MEVMLLQNILPKSNLCSTLQTGGVLQIPASTSHLLHIQERHLFECLKKIICNKWHEGVNWTEHDDYWLYPCGHMTSWHTWVDKCFVDLIMVFTCRLQSVEMAVEPSKSQCHLWDQFSDWAANLHDVEFASFFASGTLHGTKQSATLFKLDWFAITQQKWCFGSVSLLTSTYNALTRSSMRTDFTLYSSYMKCKWWNTWSNFQSIVVWGTNIVTNNHIRLWIKSRPSIFIYLNIFLSFVF